MSDVRLVEMVDEEGFAVPAPFGNLYNAHTKYITFDVVDMNYPYNAIFSRGLPNTFEAVLHSVYLCLKVLAAFGVISVHGSQKDARNIEQDIKCTNDASASKSKKSYAYKLAIEPK
jgi:hypothetical protein